MRGISLAFSDYVWYAPKTWRLGTAASQKYLNSSIKGDPMRILFICFLTLLIVSVTLATETLDIYVIDTCGGKAMILLTPAGETMLIDAGYPRQDDRDTNRIVETAQALGIEQFDYIVATHYDADHVGNIPQVDAKIPGRIFVDHGEVLPTANERDKKRYYEPYLKAIGDRKRMSVKPGVVIPMKDVQITVVTSGGDVLSEPLPGAGQPNEFCDTATKPDYHDEYDNAASVGLLFEFGRFRMLDLADLLNTVEYKLMCPNNPIGTVDLFMVSHHGFKVSNSKFLVHAIRPKAAIMNNGARKGGEPEVLDILKSSPGLQDIWQLHYSIAGKDKNAPEDFIANLEEKCEGKLIKVSAQRDGTFTVTNTRNNYSKTYKPKIHYGPVNLDFNIPVLAGEDEPNQ
jgi:competence protein ComEC